MRPTNERRVSDGYPGRANPSPTVQMHDVSVTYGSGSSAVVALHHASLEVWPENRIAIMGASGSGKSTLLHVLARLLEPTAGYVRWPRLETLGVSPAREVGVVFQGPSLLPPLSVVENVELPLLIRGIGAASARLAAAEALSQLGLDGLADALPEELSGGQSQRVAVARVLAMSPALICADEPTGQLDPVNAALVLNVLVAAADRLAVPLVVATHDPRVGDRLDDVLRLSDGALVIAGEDR